MLWNLGRCEPVSLRDGGMGGWKECTFVGTAFLLGDFGDHLAGLRVWIRLVDS